MPRLFIALSLPQETIHKIQEISCMVSNGRFLAADQMHLTIRFIGDTNQEQYFSIHDKLSMVECPVFQIYPEGVGYFPPKGSPRILWVGIRKSEELQNLRKSIDKRLVEAGIPLERTRFHPHITIVRLRDNTDPQSIIPFLVNNSLFKADAVFINSFHLFSSLLNRQGAEHTCEQTYPLIPNLDF